MLFITNNSISDGVKSIHQRCDKNGFSKGLINLSIQSFSPVKSQLKGLLKDCLTALDSLMRSLTL